MSHHNENLADPLYSLLLRVIICCIIVLRSLHLVTGTESALSCAESGKAVEELEGYFKMAGSVACPPPPCPLALNRRPRPPS